MKHEDRRIWNKTPKFSSIFACLREGAGSRGKSGEATTGEEMVKEPDLLVEKSSSFREPSRINDLIPGFLSVYTAKIRFPIGLYGDNVRAPPFHNIALSTFLFLVEFFIHNPIHILKPQVPLEI